MSEEVWMPIEGSGGKYEISSHGQIVSYMTGERKAMNQSFSTYYYVASIPGCNTRLVHRIIAKHFVHNDDPHKKTQVNHKDLDKANNHYSNLEWVTPYRNANHAHEAGAYAFGSRIGTSKLTEVQVRAVKDALSMGYMIKSIAQYFKVSATAISHIANGRSWLHV